MFFACAKAGLTLLPAQLAPAPAELAYQLDDAEPAVLLVEPEHEDLAASALAESAARPERLELGAPFPAGGVAAEAAPRDEEPLLLVYTSGTTGRPKARSSRTQLLLDERRLRPRHRRPRRRRRAPGAAAIPLRGLDRAAAPRVVEGRDGRARAGGSMPRGVSS